MKKGRGRAFRTEDVFNLAFHQSLHGAFQQADAFRLDVAEQSVIKRSVAFHILEMDGSGFGSSKCVEIVRHCGNVERRFMKDMTTTTGSGS